MSEESWKYSSKKKEKTSINSPSRLAQEDINLKLFPLSTTQKQQ
jgi:hypothetical protein